MKQRMLILLCLLLAVVATSGCTETGTFLYTQGADLERRIYGFDERQVALGELTMNYYEGGKAGAPTVLLIHGFSADRNNWPRFAKLLTDQYHILIPDLAGHGKSSYREDWSYRTSVQADRLAAFLTKLGVKKAHVAGNSMGGAITTRLALQHPGLVQSIALFDAAGVSSPTPSPMAKQLQAGNNPFLISEASAFREFWSFSMQQPPYMPGFIIDSIGQRYVDQRSRLAQIFQDIHSEPPMDEQLPAIRQPALVLWGQQDRLLDVSMAHVYADGLPHAQLVLLENVGHLPMVESPQKSAQIYLAFLRGIR